MHHLHSPMKWFISITTAVLVAITALCVLYYKVPLQTAAINIGWITGIITGLGIITSKVVTPAISSAFEGATSFIQVVQDAARLIEVHRNIDLPKLANEVSSIRAELLPNGGSSVRDAINRMEDRGIRTDRVNWAVRQDGPVGTFICDKEGSNRDVNRSYCRWLGVGAEDLLGHGWRNYVLRGEVNHFVDQEWQDAFHQGREVEFILHMRTVQGTVLELDIKAHPIQNRVGDIVEYIGVIRKVD